jgi:hypothetical protein
LDSGDSKPTGRREIEKGEKERERERLGDSERGRERERERDRARARQRCVCGEGGGDLVRAVLTVDDRRSRAPHPANCR